MTRNGKSPHQPLKGHVELTAYRAFTSGKLSLTVSPSLSNVMTELGSVYRYYRVTRLKFTIFPIPSSNSNIVAQWVAGGGSTTSGPADQSMESRRVMGISNTTAVPQHLIIERSDLVVTTPWFVTDTDATDEYLDIQGYIHIEGTANEAFLTRIELDYEFKYPMATELALASAQRQLPQEQPVPQQVQPRRVFRR